MIKNLIACEDAYINLNHSDFITAKDALLNLFKKNNDSSWEENVFEKVESNNIYRNSDNEDDEAEESEEEHEEGLAKKCKLKISWIHMEWIKLTPKIKTLHIWKE